MAESAEEKEKPTKEAEAQSAQDVLKMSGNDELKFGVLIGLIKVGQLSNKEVIDAVLNLVSPQFNYDCMFYCCGSSVNL